MRDASASADRLISTTIYVGNLPFAVSEAELRGLVLTRMPAEALGSVSVGKLAALGGGDGAVSDVWTTSTPGPKKM